MQVNVRSNVLFTPVEAVYQCPAPRNESCGGQLVLFQHFVDVGCEWQFFMLVDLNNSLDWTDLEVSGLVIKFEGSVTA